MNPFSKLSSVACHRVPRASVVKLLGLLLVVAALAVSVSNVVQAADEAPAFKVIEVQQSGGFAGVQITYRITPDGKFTRKSGQGLLKSQLDAADTGGLSKAVAAINWETLPPRLRDPNVADDFLYEMHFVVGKQTHRVTSDGVSAERNAQLKPVLKILQKIQRQPVNKKKEK